MNGFVEIMKNVAEKESQKVLTTELGIVTTIFPHADEGDTDNYQCSVSLKNKKQPDGSDFELRKVPVATPYMGMACIPNVGDLVLIQFIGGNINAPVITHRLYNDEFRPPANKENEFLLQHKIDEGGSVKLDEEGKIIITSKNEENIFTVEDEKVSIETEDHSVIIDVSGSKISVTTTGDVEMTADGNVTVESTGGDLMVKTSDSSSWQPCTISNCLFTGAPHGGSAAGIQKLKGG